MESPIERLIKTNPDMEIWWDSSPLVFEQWVQGLVDDAAPEDKAELEAQLRRLYNAEDPAKSVFRGCTTNPPLSLTAVQGDPEFWGEWVDGQIAANPDITQGELFWMTYKEVVRRGAEMFLPMYEESGGYYGWISGQLDPRVAYDAQVMIDAADEISAIGPNVMVKVPATMEGIEALRVITSKGISTNVTTCFTLPQIMAAADAVVEGLEIAAENGVDTSGWRSVITMMIGRLTEREALVEQAERRGIELTWQERHWFGIAVFRRAYKILTEEGYPSKLLACSLRDGPLVAGKPRYWDIQKIAGGDIVYTLPPYVLTPLFQIGEGLDYQAEIEGPIPDTVLEKMSKIPYCIQSYDRNGQALEDFNTLPATIYTVETFSKATNGLEAYVGERLAAARGEAEPVG